MKKIISVVSAITLAAAVSLPLSAQSFNTAYLLDNYSFNYRFNPSLPSDRTFFSLALGNISAEGDCNVGAGHFFFPDPSGSGSLVSGMNAAISSNQFIGNLPELCYENAYTNFNLASFGILTKEGFFNFEVNARVREYLGVPRDFFAFFKNGSSPTTYDMSATSIFATAYSDIDLGYSRDINQRLSVGGRFKFIIGSINANLYSDTFNVTSNSQTLNVNTDLRGALAASFITDFSIDPYRLAYDYAFYKPAGYGAAIDLGATYHITPELSVSMAVLNLGAISWNYNFDISAAGKVEFNGIEDIGLDSDDINTRIEKLMNDLKSLVDFKVTPNSFSAWEFLDCTINAGVKWRLPAYRRFYIGAMGSYTFNGTFSDYFDLRTGASILPVNWFCITGNVGYCSLGFTYGAAATLNAGIFNIHAGFEGYAGEYAKSYMVPLGRSRMSATIGLTITLCKSKNRYIPENFDAYDWTKPLPAE